MARNIYKNNLSKLKELKQARNVDMIAEEVQRMAKQINQRFYRLEKAGLGKDTAYRYAKQSTGKEKPRYTVNLKKLKGMTVQELFELGVDINQKLVSKTSTLTGQEELAKKRIEMGSKELEENIGVKIDRDNFRKFIDSGGDELLNSKYLSSEQIIEAWEEVTRSGNISNEDFIEAYNEYSEKTKFDYEAFIKSFRQKKNLARRKNRRR